jgi:hypothetical protein
MVFDQMASILAFDFSFSRARRADRLKAELQPGAHGNERQRFTPLAAVHVSKAIG